MPRTVIILSISLQLLEFGCSSQDSNSEKPIPELNGQMFACSESAASAIDSVIMRYQPLNGKYLLSTFLQDKENEHNVEHFYYTGSLESGGNLTGFGVGTPKQLPIACKDSNCQRFYFSLHSERLNLQEEFEVYRTGVQTWMPELVEGFDTTPTTGTTADGRIAGPSRSLLQAWHYALERLGEPTQASVLTSCHGADKYVHLFVPTDEVLPEAFKAQGDKFGWFSLSGKLGEQSFSASYLQNVDGHFISGSGVMSMHALFEADGLQFVSPAASLKVHLIKQ